DALRPGLHPGDLEHARGEVQRGDAGARGRQGEGVSPGSAADVRDFQTSDIPDQVRDIPFLEGDQRVAIAVVHVGPEVVSLPYGQRPRHVFRTRLVIHDSVQSTPVRNGAWDMYKQPTAAL